MRPKSNTFNPSNWNMAENKSKQAPSGAAKDAEVAQKRKTLKAALVLLVPFLGCMYLIFGGGNSDRPAGKNSFNTMIPEGRSPGIEASKQKAIERVTAERQEQRSQLGNPSSFSLLEDRSVTKESNATPQQTIHRSVAAHHEATRLMQDFYAAPKTDPQVEELKRQIEELSARLEAQPQTPDPMALAEKQYALAAKYLNPHESSDLSPGSSASAKRVKVSPVQRVPEGIVSSLASIEPDSLLSVLGRERNYGFNTPVGTSEGKHKTNILVSVDQDQILASGDRIHLRLVDDIRAGERTIEAGTVLYGTTRIESQRLRITVESIECNGSITPVELEAYDLDGGLGIYIPNSKERTAAKEAAASVGSGLGNSISFTHNAGQQVTMDVARGVMSGGTQYLASKLREVKVTVKAGYRIILISKE